MSLLRVIIFSQSIWITARKVSTSVNHFRISKNFLRFFLVALWLSASNSMANTLLEQTPSSDPCISTNPDLGDSAFWATQAVEFYADKKFDQAVKVVDACFSRWGPAAGQQQKKLYDKGVACPPTGRVGSKTKKKIHQDFLMNDVSMALWAKARSQHELKQLDAAKKSYAMCLYMKCGRAWDTNGWFWSPAEDCAKYAGSLLE